jgi:hypothetical protein
MIDLIVIFPFNWEILSAASCESICKEVSMLEAKEASSEV